MQATDQFAKEAYLLVVADGVSGRGLLTGSAGNETEGALSAPAAGKTVAGSELVAVACAALPVGSWAVGMAGGGSGTGDTAGAGSLAVAWAFSSPDCCLSRAAAAKATKNNAKILIK